MNQLLNEKLKIENMIYEVRGKQVMLVSDVAIVYNSETRIINQVVKRNINRFPEDFCFQLTEIEWFNLRSQIVISSPDKSESIHGGTRYLPYVFTEHGIMMLSGLLKSDVASKVNIQIINAFVKMRKYISSSLLSNDLISYKVLEHDKRISILEETFNGFKEQNNHLFFEGEILMLIHYF